MTTRATDRRARRSFRPALFDRLERREVLSGSPLAPTLTPVVTRLHATEGRPGGDLTVAFFSTTRADAAAGDFAATIAWGDGTIGPGTITATAFPPTTNPDTGAPIPGWTVYEVKAAHAFRATGALPVSVTVTDTITAQSASGLTATVEVSAAALSVVGPVEILQGVERQSRAYGTLALIAQAGWHAAGEYVATIEWGDGQVSPGTVVVATPAVEGDPNPVTYLSVKGQHAYAADGIRTFRVTVRADDGQVAEATGTVVVADVPVPLTGRLDPASDRGASNRDGITNDNRPLYGGQAEPGSTVEIVALRTDGGGTPKVVGRGVVPANGLWSFRTSTLVDGRYRLAATAYNAIGQPQRSADLGVLVVDTVAPVVIGARLDGRTGRADLQFRDERSGLNVATLADRSIYTLTRTTRPAAVLPPTALTVGIATPAGVRSVALTFNGGRRLGAASYVLATRAGGITDLAGNALDGTFGGRFPTGARRPGTPFAAAFQVAATGATSAPRAVVVPPVVAPPPAPRPRKLTR